MAELRETINAVYDPIIEKALQVAKIPGVRWMAGGRLDLNHDQVRASDEKVSIAVAPGLPIPVSGSLEAGFHQETHTTTNLRIYLMFSSADAPTIDGPAPETAETPGVPPLTPGDGNPPDAG